MNYQTRKAIETGNNKPLETDQSEHWNASFSIRDKYHKPQEWPAQLFSKGCESDYGISYAF